MVQAMPSTAFTQKPVPFERKAADFEIGNGNHRVRLARDWSEVEAAMALRYRIFYEEMLARPTAEMMLRKQDFDRYDEVADHLLVLDKRIGDGPEAVVGTYRLIRRDAVAQYGTFYSAAEFDVGILTSIPDEILELGRSCVDLKYRDRRVINLLWQGIAHYCVNYDIRIMFGCASLPGRDLEAHALPLSYLYHNYLAPAPIRPKALPELYVDMNFLPPTDFLEKDAVKLVPPLIKGYLRIGGFVGDGAVVDEQFNTTDVCIVVKTKLITDKYARHFERHGSNLRSI